MTVCADCAAGCGDGSLLAQIYEFVAESLAQKKLGCKLQAFVRASKARNASHCQRFPLNLEGQMHS